MNQENGHFIFHLRISFELFGLVSNHNSKDGSSAVCVKIIMKWVWRPGNKPSCELFYKSKRTMQIVVAYKYTKCETEITESSFRSK